MQSLVTWNGAGVKILPVLSRFALKFRYICRRLMVDLVLAFPTPFRFSFDRSGFMEWLDLLKPCFRGGPEVDLTFAI